MSFKQNDEELTSQHDFPTIHELEKSFNNISQDSPYYSLAKLSLEQVLSFEREKLGIIEDNYLSVKIETDLPAGSISLKVLGLVSSGVQRVYSSVYNDLFGNRKSKGKIPSSILESTELILHSATAGSFNMHIDSKSQNPILESHDEKGMDKMSDLFSHLVGDEDATFVVEKYGIRTLKVLSSWFEDLEKEKIELSLKNKNNSRIVLDQPVISRTKEKLLSVKSKEILEPITILGTIESANSSSNTLIIITNENEKIPAQASADIFEKGLVVKITDYVFKCTKVLIVNEITNEQKISYKIIDVTESE